MKKFKILLVIKRIIFKVSAIFAISTGLDMLIAKLGVKKFVFLNRFIPDRYRYGNNWKKIIVRKGVKYCTWLSDETDWEIFSNYDDLLAETMIPVLDLIDQPVVFDIGANCGRFSLDLARKLNNSNHSYKIFAFEPNPNVYKKLVYNFGLNKDFSQGISALNVGIGDKQKVLELQAPFRNRGAGSLVRDYQGEPSEKFNIEIITIDVFVEKNNLPRLDLIKIDVEGYEPNVLVGAEKTISKFLPDVCIEIIQSNSIDNGFSQDFVFSFFKNKGYNIFRIDEESQRLICLQILDDFFEKPCFNMFCSKKSLSEKILLR